MSAPVLARTSRRAGPDDRPPGRTDRPRRADPSRPAAGARSGDRLGDHGRFGVRERALDATAEPCRRNASRSRDLGRPVDPCRGDPRPRRARICPRSRRRDPARGDDAGHVGEHLGRRCRAQRRPRRTAGLADRLQRVVDVGRGLDVDRDGVGAGLGDIGHVALGAVHHHVDVDRAHAAVVDDDRRSPTTDDRTEGDLGARSGRP